MSFDAGNKLNVQNFFHYYVFHAFADELSKNDRTKALIGNLLLGLSFGIGHAICGLLYNKKYQFKKAPPEKQEVDKTKKIAQDQGVANLQQPKSAEKQQSGTGNKTSTPHKSSIDDSKWPKNTSGKKKIASAPAPLKPLSRESFPYIINRPNKAAVDPKTLTPIDNIKLSSDHPLSNIEFLFHAEARKTEKYPFKGMAQRVNYLKNLSLKDYPTVDATQLGNDFHNHPSPAPKEVLEKADQKILARINKLNEEPIAFQKRLDLLGAKPHLEFITLGDLEMPWEDSVLKIALMSDQEIKAIKLSEMANLNDRQKDILNIRVQELSSEIKVQDSEKLWRELTIGEFISLPSTADQLESNNLGAIDDEVFSLIPDRLLNELDFDQCSLEQLTALFRYKDSDQEEARRRVSLLSIDQIINNRDWFNINTIDLISQKHIKDGLDFNKLDLDQDKFNTLFPTLINIDNPYARENTLIAALNAQQIYDLSHLMDANRAACIPFDMVKKLNLSTLIERNTKEKNEELFGALFPEDKETQSKFDAFPLEKIYIFSKFLNGETLRYLPKEKLKAWDFSAHKMSEKQFQGLFVESFDWNEPAFNASRIRDLEIPQLLELESQKLMDKTRARCVSIEQVKKMDFKDAKQLEFAKKYLFDVTEASFLRDAAKDRLNALSKENLNAVILKLVKEQLNEISPSQFREIDFEALYGKLDFSMFFPRYEFHPYEINLNFYPRIHGLSDKELSQVLAGIEDEDLKDDIQKIWDVRPKSLGT